MALLADISVQLKSVPLSPGVYLWKDAAGEILYVGKAKELRRRMSQYVTGADEREKIPLMMERVASFDYVVCGSEVEALILELNLINQFSPPYNVDYRDDKTYPFIALTCGDPYPAIKYTREKHKAGTRYFGPYTDARAARETIDALRRAVPLCRSTCPEYKRVLRSGKPLTRACFDAHIGLGPGVCTGEITPEDYAVGVRRALRFLSGHYRELEVELREAMDGAAADLEFEVAAGYRNRLDAIARVKQKQNIVSDEHVDLDVIGFAREETIACAYVLAVRSGRVQYGNEYILDKGFDLPFEELASSFVARYYDEAAEVPKDILLELLPADTDVLSDYLTRLRTERSEGRLTGRVVLAVPRIGHKKQLVEMARENARHSLLRFKVRTHYDDQRTNAALLQLESALALDTAPLRIECYDISTLHGAHSVGSMVVFTNGQPDKAAYRRFKIQMPHEESNDVAMMREVLGRRFAPERREDKRFAKMPDLLIIDGGKPQLNTTIAQLEELGVEVPVTGLAKAEEELWVQWQDVPVILPDGSPSLYLVKRVRDEAHRFAIEYHRQLRGKAMTTSVLDEVVGIGSKRRKELIRSFGNFRKLRDASAEGIEAAAPFVTSAMAADIYSVLHP
ncbi:MAG: excinuclease ABC subunit UvrC [Coriobacteriia bacterium]|nr:excinuclease ABC subunit UvrC [Coriobacteriia bacterium]